MEDLRDIWQNQETEVMKLSIAELRAKAMKFQKGIRLRNLREQVACIFVIISFAGAYRMIPLTIPRISFALIIAGTVYVAWYLQARGAAPALPAEMGRSNCIDFYRRELEKQRDLLRNVWKWYLGPLIPGMALFVSWSIVIARPERRWFPIAFAAFCAVVFWGIGWLNDRGARHIDRQIRELNACASADLGS